MQSNDQYTRWIWRYIAFQLPSSWEMLQFSTEFNRGRCAFADRYQFRAELSWNIVKGEPDYERMVSNYIAKLQQEKKLTEPQNQKKAGWHGFTGLFNNERTSRFGYFLPELDCLVEWAFMWPGEREPSLENDILLSTQSALNDQEGRQTWRAFGMEMTVPRAAAIEGFSIQPAKASCSFTDPKTQNAWHMSRFGMTDLWMNISVEEWLKHELRTSTRNLMMTHRQLHGTDVVHLEGEFKPSGIHFKKGRIEAAAWMNPIDKRLYYCRKMLRKQDTVNDIPLERQLVAAPEFTRIPRS